VAAKYNKLDEPIKSVHTLENEISWINYNLAHEFSYICAVEANR